MYLDERSDHYWQLLASTNFTDSSYPSKVPTTTPPFPSATSGIIACGSIDGSLTARNVLLLPFGAGSSTNTFNMKVLGWRETTGQYKYNTPVPPSGWYKLWMPVVLSTYQVTIGSGTGVVGSDLDTTALFATTITSSQGPTSVTANATTAVDFIFFSPGSNDIGVICVRTMGFRFIECIFNMNSSATSANCLWTKM